MPSHPHPSRAHQIPHSKPARKRKQKPSHLAGTPRPKLHKVNPTKRRIRDLTRLLSSDRNIPADVRVGHERELAGLKLELESEAGEIKRSEMIGKYHMVRFFESKKAERALKRAKRKVDEASTAEEKDGAEKMVRECEVDLNYTKFYPFLKPYHALYPRRQGQIVRLDEEGQEGKQGNLDEEQEKGRVKGDVEVRRQVEEAMREGTLEALRDGNMEKGKRTRSEDVEMKEDPPKRMKNSKADGLAFRPKAHEAGNEEDDDSDGGFFE